MVPHTESEAWAIPGESAWKSLLWGWQGAGDKGAHFRTGFPEPEEALEVEGGPEGPF